MKSKFVVVDSDGYISIRSINNSPEQFGTFRAAQKRAAELAEDVPGSIIFVYEAIATAFAPIGKVEIWRK